MYLVASISLIVYLPPDLPELSCLNRVTFDLDFWHLVYLDLGQAGIGSRS